MTQLDRFLFQRTFTMVIEGSCRLQFLFLTADSPNEIQSGSCGSKEQKRDMACPSQVSRKQSTDQLEQKESTTHTSAKSAGDKVSEKPQSRTGRKRRAKK